MEATGEGAQDVRAALSRIEAAVTRGETDLRVLGFWPVVALVKRGPALIEAHADQIGRIDEAAFRARVRPVLPVWAGNVLLGGLFVAGGAALWVASATHGLIAGLALVAAALWWSVAVHSPTHWLVGLALGIRCTHYFLGGPFPQRPGLKTDYASYLRVPARSRAWFHASGALATKTAPFLVAACAPLTNAPVWAILAAAGVGVIEIATDVLFSVKTGDWKKFRREMAIARSVADPGSAPTF